MSLLPKPRRLPDADRALIDAAVAAGRLRRVPPGRSGHPGYRWCAQKGHLVAVEDGGWHAQGRTRFARARQAKRLRGAEVRAEVARLRDAGLSAAEIAGALGVSPTAVYRHLRLLREIEAARTGEASDD